MSEEINGKTYTANGVEVLFFNIGDTVYGIEIDYIKGIINIRGKMVPVISVRKRFGMEEIPYDDRTCIIVLEFENGIQVGIIVDRVQEVVVVDKDIISKTPDCKNVNTNRYIKSIVNANDGIKLLLDCDKLIGE